LTPLERATNLETAAICPEDDEMPTGGPEVNAIVGKLAERNITLERMRERIRAASAARSLEGSVTHMGPYLAVSRLRGAGGEELAQRVGASLGWPVVDHELVDLVAEHQHLNPQMVELVDEGAASWVSDVLTELMPVEVISRDAYTRHLRRVIQLLAIHGEVVFLGRLAHLFLPRRCGLSVEVVASLPDRIARVRARTGKNEPDARRDIEDADGARAEFASRTFGRDIADPHSYDLVLNSSWLPLDLLSDLVVGACRRRFPRPGSAAGAAQGECRGD
jgi:hypothetical protein